MTKNNEEKSKKKINLKTLNIAEGVALGVLLAATATISAISINNSNKIDSLNEQIIEASQVNVSLSNEINSLQSAANTFTVTYVSNDQVVYTENVEKGHDVVNVPTLPTASKGHSAAWSSDGTNIQSDTIIRSVETANTYNITYLTNIVEKGSLGLYTKGSLIDIKNYMGDTSIYFDYYLDFDGVNFFFEESYHFNSDYSKVLHEDDSELTTVYDNFFEIRGNYFTLSENHTRLSFSRSAKCDEKGLFIIDNKSFQIDYKNSQIINVTDNKVDSTEFIVTEPGLLFAYNPKTNKVTFYDETQYDVVNNRCVKDTITYYIDVKNLEYYKIGQDEIEYKTGKTAPTKATYTYGEDLFFGLDDMDLKTIKKNDFEITQQADKQPQDDYSDWRTVQSLHVIFTEEKSTVGDLNTGTMVYKPIGDIIVYVELSPGSI